MKDTTSFLELLLDEFNQYYPDILLLLRDDSGFADVMIYEKLESNGVYYAIRMKESGRLRRAAALENIEQEGLSEAEFSMVKLESVREVLFQALLLDDVKFEEGKMYAELCTILLI